MPNPESAVVEEASEPSFSTDSSVHSATIPETEVESAESVPVSDEPVVAVVTEEASSITLTDVSPDQTPTVTNTGIIDIDLCLLVSLSLSLLFHTQSHKGCY